MEDSGRLASCRGRFGGPNHQMLLRLRRIFPFFASAAQPLRFLAPKICVACGVLKMFVPAARIDN